MYIWHIVGVKILKLKDLEVKSVDQGSLKYVHQYSELRFYFVQPVGCTYIETVRPRLFLCTPLVYCKEN